MCELDLNWSGLDGGFFPYFAVGGNQLCDYEIPQCIAESVYFESSLDQFYYSFMYVIEQDCPDINNDENINILDVVLMANTILSGELPSEDDDLYNYMDINDDEDINILDIVLLVSWILGTS